MSQPNGREFQPPRFEQLEDHQAAAVEKAGRKGRTVYRVEIDGDKKELVISADPPKPIWPLRQRRTEPKQHTSVVLIDTFPTTENMAGVEFDIFHVEGIDATVRDRGIPGTTEFPVTITSDTKVGNVVQTVGVMAGNKSLGIMISKGRGGLPTDRSLISMTALVQGVGKQDKLGRSGKTRKERRHTWEKASRAARASQ